MNVGSCEDKFFIALSAFQATIGSINFGCGMCLRCRSRGIFDSEDEQRQKAKNLFIIIQIHLEPAALRSNSGYLLSCKIAAHLRGCG